MGKSSSGGYGWFLFLMAVSCVAMLAMLLEPGLMPTPLKQQVCETPALYR